MYAPSRAGLMQVQYPHSAAGWHFTPPNLIVAAQAAAATHHITYALLSSQQQHDQSTNPGKITAIHHL